MFNQVMTIERNKKDFMELMMEELTVDNSRTHLFILHYSLCPNIAGLLEFENISDLPRVPPFLRLAHLSIDTENLDPKMLLSHNGLRQFALDFESKRYVL